MKLIGITRVRNESHIIKDTLDHVSRFVDAVVVYDDCSTDNTADICEDHRIVTEVLRGKEWDSTPFGRNRAEGTLRQYAYMEAIRQGADWIYCFDADEFLDITPYENDNDLGFRIYLERLLKTSPLTTTLYCKLFDFYITPEDKHFNYQHRKYIGKEYRNIPMFFKVTNTILFRARIPQGHGNCYQFGGYVKHYGKAISIEHWEETCRYYINHRWKDTDSLLLNRWKARRGKAIHTKSDFGTELITWGDRFREDKIIELYDYRNS